MQIVVIIIGYILDRQRKGEVNCLCFFEELIIF